MKKTLYRIKGSFYKGGISKGIIPPTRRLIMILTDQIKNDMAAKVMSTTATHAIMER
jgi:hypothetical protein